MNSTRSGSSAVESTRFFSVVSRLLSGSATGAGLLLRRTLYGTSWLPLLCTTNQVITEACNKENLKP